MKKFFVLVCLMIMAVSIASAQYVTDIDGWTWQGYSDSTKTNVVLGYILALSTLYEFSDDGYKATEKQQRTAESIVKMQMLSAFKEWSIYPVTVGQIVTKVNEYYAYSAENKKNKLYLIIPWLFDKEWW